MPATLLDLLLPPRCAGCARAGSVLCPACTAELTALPARRMPDPRPAGLPACWSAGPYTGPAKKAIIAYKERGQTALAPPLAEILAFTVAAAAPGAEPFLVVPVPSSRRTTRARGHDPVGRLARLAVARLRTLGRHATLCPALLQGRRVADQAGLSATQRAANLASSLDISQAGTAALSGHSAPRVVLVDDIVTTGATLAEAARALRAAGAVVPLAVTVTATRRRLRSHFGHGE